MAFKTEMRGSKSGKCFLLIMYSSPAASTCLAKARLESGGQIQRALKWLFRENFVLLHVRTSCHHGDLLILSLFGWECESESRDEWTGQFPERESVSEILRLPHQILCWNFCNAKGERGRWRYLGWNIPDEKWAIQLIFCSTFFVVSGHVH